MYAPLNHQYNPTSFAKQHCERAIKKALALQRHSLTWVLYKMYVRTLSLSCTNRLPFSNNGWDLWEPARDQNSLVWGCTVHHARTSPRKFLYDRIKANWILWIRNLRKREVHLIVGALFGSTSISDRPPDFARYWLHMTNANSSPKKDFKSRIKTNYKHWLFNVLKANRKIYPRQDLTQDVIGTIALDSTRDICLPVRVLYLE